MCWDYTSYAFCQSAPPVSLWHTQLQSEAMLDNSHNKIAVGKMQTKHHSALIYYGLISSSKSGTPPHKLDLPGKSRFSIQIQWQIALWREWIVCVRVSFILRLLISFCNSQLECCTSSDAGIATTPVAQPLAHQKLCPGHQHILDMGATPASGHTCKASGMESVQLV